MNFKLDVAEFEHSCEEVLADIDIGKENLGAVSCLDGYFVSEFGGKAGEKNRKGERDRWGWWLSQ